MLGAASGPVCPSARCGGGGAAARGQEEFLRGNNGAKCGRSPQICLRSRAGPRDKVSSFWLWLSLLDVTEIRQDWAEMWGKRTLLISLSPEDTGEAHSESAVWLLLLRCGQRSGRRQNYSSLPPPPFCSVYTHCTLQWYVERAVAGSPEPPEAGSDLAQSGGKGAPSVSEESGVLSAHFAKLTWRWIPLRVLFLINVPENSLS